MSIGQSQLMRECFEGERERNCTYCPAHISKNGKCCFGHRYEEEDNQCYSCPHVASCEPSTMRYLEQQNATPPRRVVINRPPSAPGPAARTTQSVYNQSQSIRRDGGIIVQQNRVAQPLQVPDDMSFWKKMGMNAAWGAVEGMLEMLLGFFRQRRPD
jgi:hypothetical protein